jgi:glycosyltransferase domain-containing protein
MVSIIVPTINRPDFLIRLLRYYAKISSPFPIVIGDSSTPDHVDKLKPIIEELKNSLQLDYVLYPDLNDSQTIRALADRVKTPYVVFVADDDFLIPNSLKKCIDFLDKNADYSAVHGKGIVFALQVTGCYGPFSGLGNYPQPVVGQQRASERLLAHLSNYRVSLFSVHRTKTWQRMYQNIHLSKDKSFTELLPSCLSAVFGKIKELDCLYLIRQGHSQRYFLPDVFDWLTGPHWLSSYENFRDVLAKELSIEDSISLHRSQEIVKQAFWAHISHLLSLKFGQKYQTFSLREGYKRKLQQSVIWRDHIFPFLQMGRSKVYRSNHLELNMLLHRRSPYHADFMPFYELVSAHGEKER